MDKWLVYIHVVPNGKVYVGATSKKPKERWRYGYGYRNNKVFFCDIQKYGWRNISHNIAAERLTKEQAYEIETRLIQEYRSNNSEYGYNLAAGGVGTTGFYPDSYSRKKMSEKHKGLQNHCVATLQLNDNGEVVAKYSSIKEASIKTGINYKSIVNCCSGVTKKAGGYYWKHKQKNKTN